MPRLLLLLLVVLALAACAGQPGAALDSSPERPATHTVSPAPTLASSPAANTATIAPPPVSSPGQLTQLAAWGDGVPVAVLPTPDGAALVVATALHLQRRQTADPNQIVWDLPLDTAPAALAISPDGATLALARATTVELRDAADGAITGEIDAGAPVTDLAYSPNGARLALALDDERLLLWDIAAAASTQELRLPEDPDGIRVPGALSSTAFSPDGELVAAGDVGGNVMIWRVADGQSALVVDVGPRVVADIAFSPDGKQIAAASEGWRAEAGAAWLWDVASGAQTARLTLDSEQEFLAPVERVAYAPAGGELALSTSTGDILRWSLPDGQLREQRVAHRAMVVALAYTPAGELLSAGRDGRLHIGQTSATIGLAGLSAAAVSPNGSLVVTGGEDGIASIWRPDGTLVRAIDAHSAAITALTVSPDGTLLVSASDDGAVRLWSLPDGERIGELRGHERAVLSLAFSPSGAQLATGGSDGSARLWRMPDGAPERTITVIEDDGFGATAVFSLAFSGEELLNAGAYGGEVRRWRVSDGAAQPTLTIPEGSWVTTLSPSVDGTQLAALDSSGQIALWAADNTPTLTDAIAGASSLAWGSNGGLLTVDSNSTLLAWSIVAGNLEEASSGPTRGDSLATAAGAPLVVISRQGRVEVWNAP